MLNLFYFFIASVLTLSLSQKVFGQTTTQIELPKINFQGFIQTWYFEDSTNRVAQQNFRVRRAWVRLTGSVIPKTRWIIMVDPAKNMQPGPISPQNDNTILQEAGQVFELTDHLELWAGQFKIQTMAEGLDGIRDIPFPERSFLGRTYGLKREPGLTLVYKKEQIKVAGIVANGQATNALDNNNTKDFGLRFDYSPSPTYQFGTFILLGDFQYSEKDRLGINARYRGERLITRLEAVQAHDEKLASFGWVLDGSYQIHERWVPTYRFEHYIKQNVETNIFSLGTSYLLSPEGNPKINFSYSRLDHATGNQGQILAMKGISGDLWLLSFQVAL